MKYPFIILISSLTLYQCKKKENFEVKDTVRPIVEITSPTEGQVLTSSMSVFLRGSANDNTALKTVSAEVENEEHVKVFSYTISESDFTKAKIAHHGPHNMVDKTSVLLDTIFISNNTPGTYTFVIRASDMEDNIESKSVKFQIQ